MSKEADIEGTAGQETVRAPSVPTKAVSKENKEPSFSEASEESQPAVSNAGAPVAPVAPPPYSAFSKPQRNFLLSIVTVAGFFGPLSGGIYLPALPVLAVDFNVSDNAINATVSVFMVVFAVGVRSLPAAFPSCLSFPLIARLT